LRSPGPPFWSSDASFENRFEGYLVLKENRLLLAAQHITRCESEAACDALGISGDEGQASPGCNPQVEDCSELPSVINFFSGAEIAGALYSLDVGEDEANMVLVMSGLERFDFYGEGPLSLESQILTAENAYGFRVQEYVGRDDNPRVRHVLTLVSWDGEGEAEAVTINTPGYPLALLDGGSALVSIEPSGDETYEALVHRSTLENGGAYIDSTARFEAGFRDSTSIDGEVFLLFGPADPCDDDPISQLVALDTSNDTPSLGDGVELAGNNWSFTWYERPWPRDRLVLSGGPAGGTGRASLDVSGELTLRRYFVKAR
jgi:hypothetical protein